MIFKLNYTTDNCDVYEWMNKNEREKMTILHYKDKNVILFEYCEFVLKDESLLVPMTNETDSWLKHSCRYGHWQKRDFEYNTEVLEFALALLQKSEYKPQKSEE